MVGTTDEATLHAWLCYFILFCGFSAFVTLVWFTHAPCVPRASFLSQAVTAILPCYRYGRYSQSKGWGPLVNAKLAWVLMETPNLWV